MLGLASGFGEPKPTGCSRAPCGPIMGASFEMFILSHKCNTRGREELWSLDALGARLHIMGNIVLFLDDGGPLGRPTSFERQRMGRSGGSERNMVDQGVFLHSVILKGVFGGGGYSGFGHCEECGLGFNLLISVAVSQAVARYGERRSFTSLLSSTSS
jgi:hypothetical protein